MKNQSIYHSPIGDLYITTHMNELFGITFNQDLDIPLNHTILIDQVIQQLDEYFKHTRTTFTIPMKLSGTDFQQRVYQNLLNVTYGQIVSYQDIAISLGDKHKARAVGGALNKNPIMVVVPCHRVIGKDHSLTGFAGGLEVKKVLLELEQKNML